LEAGLRAFQSYLEDLGFQKIDRPVSVQIVEDSKAKEGVALWEPLTASILVTEAFARDEASVLRQLAHQYLHIAQSESPEYSAIESGLATYFSCSFLDHPVIGDKATQEGKTLLPLRDLRNDRQVDEIDLEDWVSIQNDGSEIWGAVLWQVRMLLGKQRADRLVAETWRSLEPEIADAKCSGAAFVTDIINRMKLGGVTEKQSAATAAAFEKRGLHVQARGPE
jgi:hypothetical protein